MQAIFLGFLLFLALAYFVVTAVGIGGSSKPLEFIFDTFKEPDFAIALTGGIIAVALLSAIVFYVESVYKRQPIRALIKWLDKNADGDERFAEVIDEFGRQIPAMHAPLGHAWDEFSESLIRPDPSIREEAQVVRNTVRPSTYFNVQATIEAGYQLPFWQALPNYFVGFGLVCTFLGLVSGLFFAAKGVGGEDVHQAQKALTDLLHAATFKFLTSIAGVLASLVLSVFIRRQVQALQHQLDRLCSALEKRLVFVTPEGVALDQLRQQIKLTETFERFGTDLAVQIADALEARMTKALTGADGQNLIVGEIRSLGDTFRSNAGDIGADVGSTVVKGLSEPLASLGEIMNQLSNSTTTAVTIVNEFSDNYSQKLAQATQRFEEGISRAADRISDAAKAAGESVVAGAESAGGRFAASGVEAGRRIDEASAKIIDGLNPLLLGTESLANQLAEVQKVFEEYDAKVAAMSERISGTISSMSEVGRNMQASSANLLSAAQPIQVLAGELNESSRRTGEVAESVTSLIQNVEQLSSSITTNQEKLTVAWEDYRRRFDATDERLAATFVTLQDGIRETEAQVKDFVSALDDHFAKATNTLGGVISDLTDAAEEMSSAIASRNQ